MFPNLRYRLRRRLLGNRFLEGLQTDHRTIGRLGNHHYLFNHSSLVAPDSVPDFNAYEFSYYSQNGEDGLILHLLSRVGCDNHFIVEIGTEDGRECNSANLIFNFGWRAVLIEAAGHWAEKGRQYFSNRGAGDRVSIINAAATPANINELLKEVRAPEDMDILSIDIDSYDYWVWEAVQDYSPKIVVIEYNASFGPSRAVTIPPDALAGGKQKFPSYYHGASITALQMLGVKKGYDLVGCDSRGVNSFFVRCDLTKNAGLEIVKPQRAYRRHFRRSRKRTTEQQFQAIAHLPLTEVS